MKLTEACINRPVFAWMLMAATVVFGGVAATRIGISQMPDVDFPTINVTLTWPGAAPEVIENDVVELIEEAVVQVEGIRSVTSSSRQGQANVTIELALDRDVELALQDVQTKIAQAQRNLPRDLEPPIVSKANPEDHPIMWVALSGPYAPQLLSDVARYRVKERLQTVPGVGEVMMGGFLERNVRIWMDAEKLDAHGVTVSEVIAALQRGHVELPAGQLQTQGREVNVRVMGEALGLDALRQLIVREQGGAPVRLQDVALVEDGFEDVRRLSRLNGAPTQGLGVKKQRGSNAVAVARAVKAELAQIRETLPEGMALSVNFDSTKFIEESVHEIEFELVLAVILTALVCWMFLGSLSSTLNVVLAIPMSLLGTLAVIYFFGFTLNTFTLLAMSLAVGIVVDDAIMVLENIFRHFEKGKPRVRAAREGTAEISFAALAASLAVIAIFIPVVFMEGIVGKFFLQFGVTLCVAVLLSYLEAMTLAPARCAQMLRNPAQDRRGPLGRAVDRAFDGLSRVYGWILAHSLRWPIAVLVVAALVFAGSFLALREVPREFVPSQDQSRFIVRLQTMVGASIEEMDRLQRRAEDTVRARPEVNRVYSVVGGFGGDVNTGIMMVTLVPPDERARSQQQVAAEVRRELNALPGLRAVVQDLSQSGFTARRGFPIDVSVRGGDWDQLVAAATGVRERLAASGLATDVDTDYQVGMPELRIVPDRERASDLGVSIQDVATTVNALVGGIRVGKYTAGGRRVDVRLRLLRAQRSRTEDLSRLRVRSRSGDLLPLASLVTTEERPTIRSITRQDRERAINIFGNVAPGQSQQAVLAEVERMERDLPPGTRIVLGGASAVFQESMGGLVFALILGIIVAYMVLASQFNSFLHPITVLTIMPLSVAGAFVALWLTGRSLNIFSMIGVLLLLGIVKKNSILLVDYATRMRGEGNGAREAMLIAGPVRLRPILMTSMATLMAALPIALGVGAGSEIRTPMAIAVIGGLVVSTSLSLVVVPAFYVVADDVRARLTRGRRRRVPVSEPDPRSTGGGAARGPHAPERPE